MNSSYNYADFIGLDLDSTSDRKKTKKNRTKKLHQNENSLKAEKADRGLKTRRPSE